MIFSNGLDDKVRDGTKTQTRRLVRLHDWRNPVGEITEVCGGHNRLKWKVGRTYAIQPKRGAKGDGRFRIIKIRKENIQSITETDARAEGVRKLYRCPQWMPNEAILSFKQLWGSINKKKGTRWEDNPLVWVLEIENVGCD